MFVLIHSPLVGPFTWSRVAAELEKRGEKVLVARLCDDAASPAPIWQQHANCVADALEATPVETRVILVAHSGAGPLLPAIGHYSPRPVAGYLFVDAGILFQDASHLDLRAIENPEMAREFERELRNGARFPAWTSDDLREDLTDATTREALVRELQPRGLNFFSEMLPVFDFPDAPCAYLQFTPWYESYAEQARARGWAFEKMEAGHFEMLVQPVEVADKILRFADEMRE